MANETSDRPEIQFHDDISGNWETLHKSNVFQSRTAAMFSLLQQHNLAGQAWLDAGCGTGTLSHLLAQRCGSVTGVDASSQMIALARTGRLAAQQPDRLQFEQITTIAQLPFGDRSFDGVLCASVLEYVPDVQQCLRELQRVVRPGGLLLLSIPNRRSWLRQGFKLGFAASRRLGSRPLFRYMQFSKFDASASSARQLLESQGFSLLGLNFAGSPLPQALDRLACVGTLINILARRTI